MSEAKARLFIAISITVGTHVLAAVFATFTPLSFSEALSAFTLGILAMTIGTIVSITKEDDAE
jgi:hypothetical protein